MDNTTFRGSVEMTAAMIISGTIGWFVVMSGQDVVAVVFWRCLFGAATLALVCAAMGFFRRGTITRNQVGLATLGGLAIVGNWLLLFAAYSRASISIATAVYNTQPFMLVGLGTVFFAERLTTGKLAWLFLAFAGMLTIVQAKADPGQVGSGDYLVGILLSLGAALLYAVAAIIAKKLKGTPPHLIALIQVSIGALALAPLMNFQQLPADAHTWSLLAAVGIVHTGVMYILLYGAIQKLPTSLTGALSFIYPIVAIFVDRFAFGHRLQAIQFLGAAAILVAAAGTTLGLSLRKTTVAARQRLTS